MYTHTGSGQRLRPPAAGSAASREDRKGRPVERGAQGPAGRSSRTRAPDSTRCRRRRGSVWLPAHVPHWVCIRVCRCAQTQVPRKQPRTISERRQPHAAAGPSEINEEEENPSAFLPLLSWFPFPTKCYLQKHQKLLRTETKQNTGALFFQGYLPKHRSFHTKRQTPPG